MTVYIWYFPGKCVTIRLYDIPLCLYINLLIHFSQTYVMTNRVDPNFPRN